MCVGLRSFAALSVEEFLYEESSAKKDRVSLSLEVTQDRHGAEILPYLWLSDYTLSLDLEELVLLGITHIIDCRCISPLNFLSSGLKYLRLPVADEVAAGATIKKDLTSSFNWIEASRASGGRVLVHCSKGNKQTKPSYLFDASDMTVLTCSTALLLRRLQV
jgi:hypothetical protein